MAHGEAVVRLGAAALVVYVGLTAWRLATAADFQAAVEGANEEREASVVRELSALFNSPSLAYGVYVAAVVSAAAVFVCAWRGVASRDRNLLRWHWCGALGCALLMGLAVASLAVLGPLCVSDTSEAECDNLRLEMVVGIVVAGLLVLMYLVSVVLACMFMRRLREEEALEGDKLALAL